MGLNLSRKRLVLIINRRQSKFVIIYLAAALGFSGCSGTPLKADKAVQAEALITDVTTVRLRRRQGWGCFVSLNYRPADRVNDVNAVIAERGNVCHRLKKGKTIRIIYDPKNPDRVKLFNPA